MFEPTLYVASVFKTVCSSRQKTLNLCPEVTWHQILFLRYSKNHPIGAIAPIMKTQR